MNLKSSGMLYRVAVAAGLVLCFLYPAGLFQALAAPAPSDRQESLALDYRFAISRTTNASEREALYLRLINECPDTEIAEEAYWALSNLYLDDFDEPKEDQAREILEKFLERYPSSQWRQHVENRLSWFWGK